MSKLKTGVKIEGTTRSYGQHIIMDGSRASTVSSNVSHIPTVIEQDIPVQVSRIKNIVNDLTSFGSPKTLDKTAIALAAAISKNKAFVQIEDTTSKKNTLDDSLLSVLGDFVEISEQTSGQAIVLGSKVNNNEEVKKALLESQKIDNVTTVKSKESQSVEFNTLKQPKMSAGLVYNFFSGSEGDFETQEDVKQDPLFANRHYNVPRYVELKWEPAVISDPLSGEERLPELTLLRRNLFHTKRGVMTDGRASFKFDPAKKLKNFSTIKKDGIPSEIIDVHAPEVGIENTENFKMFRNAIFSIVNTRKSSSNINKIPIKENNGNTILYSKENVANRINVNFSNFGLSKILNAQISADNSSNDDFSLITHDMANLKIAQLERVGFPSIPELLGIDYVGYIVDKERLMTQTGTWLKVHEYRFVGSEASLFRDTRIIYGQTYRYRIRSVAKVTLGFKKKTVEDFDLARSLDKVRKDLLVQDFQKNIKKIATESGNVATGIKPKISSGKASTKINIGDAVVEINDGNTKISSNNSTKVKNLDDIERQKLSKMSNNNVLNGTVSKTELAEFLNKAISQFFVESIEYKSFYFESENGSPWQYVHIEENVPPPAPTVIHVVASSRKKSITVMWLLPSNAQRDIRFVKLYRRKKVGEFWSFLGQFEGSETFFVDQDVNFEDKYIYALSCVDVHGIESFLSIQIQAELNSRFEIEKKERPLIWISGGGLATKDINKTIKKFKNTKDVFVAKQNVVVKPSLVFNDTEKDFIIRITSLDTHEKKEFKISARNVNVKK